MEPMSSRVIEDPLGHTIRYDYFELRFRRLVRDEENDK